MGVDAVIDNQQHGEGRGVRAVLTWPLCTSTPQEWVHAYARSYATACKWHDLHTTPHTTTPHHNINAHSPEGQFLQHSKQDIPEAVAPHHTHQLQHQQQLRLLLPVPRHALQLPQQRQQHRLH